MYKIYKKLLNFRRVLFCLIDLFSVIFSHIHYLRITAGRSVSSRSTEYISLLSMVRSNNRIVLNDHVSSNLIYVI